MGQGISGAIRKVELRNMDDGRTSNDRPQAKRRYVKLLSKRKDVIICEQKKKYMYVGLYCHLVIFICQLYLALEDHQTLVVKLL
jgi:hypothetical protein